MSGRPPKFAALETLQRLEARAGLAADAADLLRDRHDLGLYRLRPRAEPSDLHALPAELDDALKVRAFALFEHAARACWRDYFGRDATIRTRDLVDGLAARCGVPDATRGEVHQMRDHRNDLVDRGRSAEPLRLFKSALARFLSYFPDGWGRP